MKNGGWTLVFKTIAGISGIIKDIWKDSLSYKEHSLEALNKDNSFKHHYKNRIVLHWKMFNPVEARVVLYNQTKELVVMKFNVIASNNTDWFSVHRLQQSPWKDIFSSPINIFGIDGWCIHTGCRSFFMNSYYNTCDYDVGWFYIGRSGVCVWDTRFPRNSIQYSNSNTSVTWNQMDKVATAEVFAVYLR
ncbi:uncharacterized protein LOC114526644 [Dendronephthya gigantea]|uniref:uncharacterized protein LOC114526644 n=1 Tax=Dendronephthya gigantea TaxID=151771 RepID=UPI00106C9BB2|nr:uncharacterized protein LOC114526644 [Dendronephthya gigantea]XP_028404037.1 uncharacterized protein LOC114526644 [Dendronephthya gigantea]